MAGLAGKRVLVTGGTGFIGGRLVEKLVLEQGAKVRVLTSNYAGAARVARFEIELVRGNVTDPATVAQAAQGCEAIFHCAYGGRGNDRERRLVTVEGTRAVLEAALKARVQRVVHVSTMVVYGVGIDGVLDETMPKRPTGLVYADSKLAAETLVLDYVKRYGLAASVIQPTAVYGPFAPSWTVRVLTTLKQRRVILVDGGSGYSNAVYVDDVVDAMLLAAAKDSAVGEAFLISSGEVVSWRDFYACYEAMLGVKATVSMSRAEAKAYYAQTQRRRWLGAELAALLRDEPAVRERLLKTRELGALYSLLQPLAAGRLLGPIKARLNKPKPALPRRPVAGLKPIQAEHPKQVDFLAAKTEVKIDKAKRLLGFKPAFEFDRGMALTEAWARWAGLLGEA